MSKIFPEVQGHNIDGDPYSLPHDFGAEYNLILMAFVRAHQNNVNTWLSPMREYEAQLNNFKVYEVPTLGEFNWMRRKRLDMTMSAGISDPVARATTITLYTDLDAMQQALGYPDYEQIRVYLVDRDGEIYWESAGDFSQAKFTELRGVMADLSVEIL